MVREVLPRVHIYSLALIVSAFHRASSSKVSPVDCTRFDIAELEDYLSKVHPENLSAIDTMIGKFTSPVTELPFGALRSDWRRLLLLRRAQPEGSILREKLGRLFRILAVAYFQANERSDITEQPVFSTSGSNWDCSTSERAINFEEDQEDAEILGTPLTDSTETNQVSESLTSTTLLGHEDASRVSDNSPTISDTTEPHDKRFDFSTNPVDPSLITIGSSTFHANTLVGSTTQSVNNQNSAEEERSSENLNHSTLGRNNSTDNSVKTQIGGYISKLIGSAELSAPETEQKLNNSSINTVDTSVITVTATIFDLNTVARSTTESPANQKSISEDKSSEVFENNEDDDKIDADSRFTTQEYPEINTSNITSSLLHITPIVTIKNDKSWANLGNLNDSLLDDDLADQNFDADPRFTTQEHPETNASNITSSLLNITPIANIKNDQSLANLGNLNDSLLDDDLANRNFDADPRFTTQEHPETNASNITSSLLNITPIATIKNDKSLANLGNLNNSLLDDDLANHNFDADPRFTTQEHPETNASNITSSLLDITSIATIKNDQSLANLGNLNNSLLDDDLANHNFDADPRFTTQEHPETNASNITPSLLDITSIANIKNDKSWANLGNLNNSLLGDDLANHNFDADPRFTTQEHPETNASNITSSLLNMTPIATIKNDKSLANLRNLNNSLLDDDLANHNFDADPRFTTQEHPETNASNITSSLLNMTPIATIKNDQSLANLGNLNNSLLDDDLADQNFDADPRFTTQEHPETNASNITSSLQDITPITTIARSSAGSSTSRTIIKGDESSENLKVVPLERPIENGPVNKHQGTKMAAVGKETVGFVKDGSSDHFRGAEVATVAAAAAAAAAVGGSVASKSSVAGAGATVEKEDARPITSPVSESDTPVTPLASDFSASRIRGYGPGIMNVEPAGRIKESGSVVPTSTEIAIARGRGDSPLVYTPMNSEDQGNIAGYSGAASTSDPGMTDVKTMIQQSRVHIDRIRGNEVSDGVPGRQSVRQKDDDSSSPRSIQNSVPYRHKIRKPSVSTVDSGFSRYIVTPRIVASTAGSASNRPDRPRGNWWSRTGPRRSKKRGSLNTDVEKSYRWFYNAEKEGGRDSDQRGIQIECGGSEHVHGT